jgi:hypothetical protein
VGTAVWWHGAEACGVLDGPPVCLSVCLPCRYNETIETRNRMMELVPPGRAIFLRPLKVRVPRAPFAYRFEFKI